MLKEKFFDEIEISNEDKIHFKKYAESKGVKKHHLLKEMLTAWSDENEKIKYTEIASTYRYDKRIRNTLYKYFALIEEYYRGILLDFFYDNSILLEYSAPLKIQLNKRDRNLDSSLESIKFDELISVIKDLPLEYKSICHFVDKGIRVKTRALINFRNTVMHNKFLLMYRGFQPCSIAGLDKSQQSTLKANILNLIEFLPNKEIRKQLIDDINICSKDKLKIDETKWELPDMVVITL